MRGEGQDKDQVNHRIETELAMSRRPPQAPPPSDNKNKESEQEDVSSEAKQKVQKNIMTFFQKETKEARPRLSSKGNHSSAAVGKEAER
jgi:hypothetical protein